MFVRLLDAVSLRLEDFPASSSLSSFSELPADCVSHDDFPFYQAQANGYKRSFRTVSFFGVEAHQGVVRTFCLLGEKDGACRAVSC